MVKCKKMVVLKEVKKGRPACRMVGPKGNEFPVPESMEDMEIDPNFHFVDDITGETVTCPMLSRDGREVVFNTLLAATIGIGQQGYVEAVRQTVA